MYRIVLVSIRAESMYTGVRMLHCTCRYDVLCLTTRLRLDYEAKLNLTFSVFIEILCIRRNLFCNNCPKWAIMFREPIADATRRP